MQNQDDFQLNISLAEQIGIKPEEYIDIPIDILPLSMRSVNLFTLNGITTLQLLLKSTPQSLNKINGFGKECIEEVKNLCTEIKNMKISELSRWKKVLTDTTPFRPYSKLITSGNFTFASGLNLSDEENLNLCQLKEAFDFLGEELAFECVVSPQKVLPIIKTLKAFQIETLRHFIIKTLVDSLPKNRKNNKALPYIQAFSSSTTERNILQNLCITDNTTIVEMSVTANFDTASHYLLFIRFLKWCNFDLSVEIEHLFEKLYENENDRIIIQDRARKKTLEEIGLGLGVTKERIRQIYNRLKKTFEKYCCQNRIIPKISSELNGEQVILPLKIEEFGWQNTHEFLSLLKTYKSKSFVYDQQLDVFIFGNNSFHERVNQCIEMIPDIVRTDKIDEILKKESDDNNIPTEILKKAFLNSYQLTGELYHCCKLTLTSIYKKVLEKYYPNGLKVYDTNEIKKFKELIISEYGDLDLPQNDRALAARISDNCILCGRGIYKLKQKKYISDDLSNRIHKYIVDSDNPIFLTNTLFSIFEDELLEAGITNKYYLQGVLRELFSKEFTFRRDYISKDENITSVYSSIVKFIKRFEYPVSKAQIQKNFPGVTEIVISLAINDSNILNYFGEYLHVSHLKLSDSEKNYLYEELTKLLSDRQAHHSKDIYEIINFEKPEILKRNAALCHYNTFSILEYLFKDVFQFSRPYIAQNGVDIGRPAERLHDLIYSNDEFEVSEIGEFARENRYQIQSVLNVINECNDEYLLINASTMMNINCIGITSDMAETIDSLVANNVTHTIPIYELTIWNELPKINVPWTEWLLYSVLNKWSHKISVSTSSNQFRMAVPLIAPIGKMDISAFADMNINKHNNLIKIDNLDDIDSLLEDILDDTMLEEKI